MIIWMDRPLASDHLDQPSTCKWSSGSTGFLQMIIWIDQPLANNHLDWPASCKWSFWSTSLLQLIIRIDRPLANNHLDEPASCKWSSISFSHSSYFPQKCEFQVKKGWYHHPYWSYSEIKVLLGTIPLLSSPLKWDCFVCQVLGVLEKVWKVKHPCLQLYFPFRTFSGWPSCVFVF